MYTEASEANAPAPHSRALPTLRHPDEQGGSQTHQEVEKGFSSGRKEAVEMMVGRMVGSEVGRCESQGDEGRAVQLGIY